MFTDRWHRLSARQRAGAAFLVISAMGVGGTWYGIDYYRSAADCGADVRVQNTASTVVRTDLATKQNDAVNTLLNSIGELIVNPPPGDNSAAFKKLFQDYRMTTDYVSAERVKHPIVPLPEECK